MTVTREMTDRLAVEASAARAGGTAQPIEWKLHRARRQPLKAFVLLAIIIAVAALSAQMMGQWVAGVFAMACLLGSTTDFLFPLRFRIDRSGISVKGFGVDREMPWEAVKRITTGSGWIHLSPFKIPTRLDRFRGLQLVFAPEDTLLREDILAAVTTFRIEVMS